MRIKILVLIIITFMAIFSWRFLQPVKIITVHANENHSVFDIVVKYPPLTNQAKIKWWDDNMMILREKYDVPVDEKNYSVYFWASDYKADSGTDQDNDLLCFDDIESDKKCISKDNQPMTIWYLKNKNETIYLLNQWENKYIKDNKTGAIEKIR